MLKSALARRKRFPCDSARAKRREEVDPSSLTRSLCRNRSVGNTRVMAVNHGIPLISTPQAGEYVPHPMIPQHGTSKCCRATTWLGPRAAGEEPSAFNTPQPFDQGLMGRLDGQVNIPAFSRVALARPPTAPSGRSRPQHCPVCFRQRERPKTFALPSFCIAAQVHFPAFRLPRRRAS